ncbi:MAG TPA: TMEM175 family protein [Verrucomicrobiae bacterium]|nr:TMEM175 family protein [Verrucomicrobiae bacterium]
MQKNRLEAFSDGVIAIIITIMVLNLPIPDGATPTALETKSLPVFFVSYLLSFFYVGIYWNNHHHMLHATQKVSGGILWANLHLLFWLSLIPFATAWMAKTWISEPPAIPTAVYGFVLLMAAIAYYILQTAIIHKEGRHAMLAAAIGTDWKGKCSLIIYATTIPMAFVPSWGPWISNTLFIIMGLMWLVPDKRIERVIEKHGE